LHCIIPFHTYDGKAKVAKAYSKKVRSLFSLL